MNADCKKLSTNQKNKLKLVTDTSYHWYIPDDADTTRLKQGCAYDRFIVRGDELRKRIKDVYILDFVQTFNLSAKVVSPLLLKKRTNVNLANNLFDFRQSMSTPVSLSQ